MLSIINICMFSKYKEYSPGFISEHLKIHEKDVLDKLKYNVTLKNMSHEEFINIIPKVMIVIYDNRFLTEDERKDLSIKVLKGLLENSHKLKKFEELFKEILPDIINMALTVDRDLVIDKKSRIVSKPKRYWNLFSCF
jgi:hypothetical protein